MLYVLPSDPLFSGLLAIKKRRNKLSVMNVVFFD
jgi:hypothetical protein